MVLIHIPESIAINLVMRRPVGIDPYYLRLNFKVRLGDVRAADETHATGDATDLRK